jgi:hypothetical protein
LALIIFVVSEKKAYMIKAKLYMNVHWMVLYKLYVFCSDMKFKMAATAGLSLTLDPMGKMFQNACIVHLVIKKNNWSYVKTMFCSGSHLGITINIKNTKFVKDLPMIDAQFRFKQCNSFRALFVLLAIMLSVLRCTDSAYPFGIFKLFFHVLK